LADDIVVKVEGLEELQKALQKFPKEFERAAKEALGPGLAMLESGVKVGSPVDTGALRSSIGSQVVKGPGSTIIGKVGSSLEYAPYALEYGRKPGRMPPSWALEEWAGRHGMSGMGFVIARAIGARGLPAKRILSKTLEEKKDRVVKMFEQGISKALKRLLG